MSIRLKLFGAFLFAVFSAAALAAVALLSTWSLGDLTQRLYDEPLQAINHARAAQTAFAVLSRLPDPFSETGLRDQALGDLKVVRDRIGNSRVEGLVSEIEADLVRWWKMAETPQTSGDSEAVAAEIQLKFEILAEAAASGGFRFWLEAEKAINDAKAWTAGVIAAVFAGTLIVVFLLSRNIIVPLGRLEQTMTALARGQRNVDVPDINRIDEIGDMGRAVGIFKTAMNQVEDAREAAEAATRAKSEFLAMMSHEIRTPMSGVIGMARILNESELQAADREAAETILHSGESLMTILNDILDFSKLEAGRLELEERDFSLPALIESSVALMQGRAGEKDLSLEIKNDPDVPIWLKGDSGRLRQVVLNLLSNAIKFTDQGGVTVSVSRAGEGLSISVKDTGIGMDETASSRLFQEFVQADETIAGRFGGTGLGLAISKKIIDQMGGEISVESEPGRGTCFTVSVSLPEGDEPTDDKISTVDLPPLRVLVAEDNTVIQTVMRWVLEQHGHEVAIAENGMEAVELAAMTEPDIILMDLHMPVMNGLEATRRILEANPDVPVIATTAGASEKEFQACIDAGMTGAVAKPVQPEDLFQEISRVLGQETGEQDMSDEVDALQLLSSGDEPVEARIWQGLVDQLGPELAIELAQDFMAASDAALVELSGSDEADIAEVAHRLKSAAGSLGLREIWQICENIETAALDGDIKSAETEISRLSDTIQTGHDYLKKQIASLTDQ